jgi:hypothetical protein
MSKNNNNDYAYDVCLSFAGEQRAYVNQVASALSTRGVRVFFDDYENVTLWGKDLYSHLDEVYQFSARYCVLFASKEYAKKVWTNHERRSAQARAIKAKGEYILPARFDNTPIPGLPDTIHYMTLSKMSPLELAEIILKKVGLHERRCFLPPVPNKLFTELGISDNQDAEENVYSHALGFLDVLKRMSQEERDVILIFLSSGCSTQMPRNIHINIDYLRRLTGKTPVRLKRILGGLRSLGFICKVKVQTKHKKDHCGELGCAEIFELKWLNLSYDSDFPALLVAYTMVSIVYAVCCEKCAWLSLERLDFSQLASCTTSVESHNGPANKVVHPKKQKTGQSGRQRKAVKSKPHSR